MRRKYLAISLICFLISLLIAVSCFAGPFVFRDEFSTTRDAGAVHNSAAEPGVGTRTVVDTTNLMSISGGNLVINGTGAGSGDPGIWFPAVTRAKGKMVISQFTPATGNMFLMGFDKNTSGLGYATGGLIYVNTSVLANGTTGGVIGTIANGTTYTTYSILRAAGGFTFVKTGTGYPLLYWVDGTATDTDATLYPTIGISTATINTTVPFLRIPSTLYLPVPLCSDGFGTAFGNSDGLGHAEGIAGGLGSGGSGKTWSGTTFSVSGAKAINTPTLGEELATGTLTVGTWYSITATEENHFYTGCAVGHTFRAGATTALDANNKVKAITLSELISVVETSTRDVIATVAISTTPAGTQAGLAIGIDSATDPKYGVIAYHDGTNAKLNKLVNGTWTNVISAAATWANDAEIRVIRDGTSFRLYYNNAQIGSTSTISDVGDGTKHGLFNTHTTPIDNLTIYARGTGGEYSNLNAMMSPPNSGGGFGIGYGYMME